VEGGTWRSGSAYITVSFNLILALIAWSFNLQRTSQQSSHSHNTQQSISVARKMKKSIWPVILVTLAASSAASSVPQAPLTDPTYEALGASGVRTLTHESHPDHSLTIKAHGPKNPSIESDAPTLGDICPGATSGYTGYLNHGDKHFYFAYFESRSKPAEDPLVLWLNGGPGCSSMTGLFMELGPCTVNEDGESARENPHSWISAANVFFLDQPVSHSDPPFSSHIDIQNRLASGFPTILMIHIMVEKAVLSQPARISTPS